MKFWGIQLEYKYIKYKPLYLSKPVFRGNLQH